MQDTTLFGVGVDGEVILDQAPESAVKRIRGLIHPEKEDVIEELVLGFKAKGVW